MRRRTKRFLSTALCVAAVAAAAMGCGNSTTGTETTTGTEVVTDGTGESTTESGTKATTEAEGRKTITIGETSVINKIDPVNNGSNAWSLTADGISETIFMQDEKGNLTSHIAESVTQKDALTWELKLKEGVKFSDGSAVDADALSVCMNAIMEHDTIASASAGIITFTPIDELTVELKTERETTIMASVLCEWPIVVFKQLEDGSFLFTGPYAIQNMNPGVSLELVPNPYYDDRAGERPNVVLKAFADGATMQQAFESGEIDMAFTVTPETARILEDGGYNVKDIDAGYQYFMVLNSKENETLSDLSLREAINLAVNREDMVTALKGGRVANGFFAQYYSFAGEVEEKYDPEEAKAKLAEAGYSDTDGDGFVDKDGEKLTLKLVTYPSRPDLSILMQLTVSNLNAIGIDATTEITDSIANYLKTEEYDIAFYAQHTAPTGDPTYALSQFFRTNQGINYNEYSNERVDALLDEMGTLPAGDEKDKLAKEVQQIISEDLPVVYLVDPQWHIAVSDALADYQPYCGDYYVVNPELGLSE
ncbi:MAG: ABC transporter substrate-binding protein [bacterium]|nr:ABC transporter substrate-binding protein [bacterium]